MGGGKRVVVYGAGGHGRVVAEVVHAGGAALEGFIDDGIAAGERILGLPVLGGASWLWARGDAFRVALAIGDNRRREAAEMELKAKGLSVETFVHPRAWVSPTAVLGAGTVVMAMAVVNAEARVGRGVILNTGCVVEHECMLGDFVHVSPNAALGGRTRVGPRSHVGIGASARQLSVIGADCVVGAGAAVVREVLDGQTVVGVPAKPLR